MHLKQRTNVLHIIGKTGKEGVCVCVCVIKVGTDYSGVVNKAKGFKIDGQESHFWVLIEKWKTECDCLGFIW